MHINDFDLETHHRSVMEALRMIDKIFSKNGIQYYLIEGSALGAVRHQNIIPWDDDVDIGIFLKDREKVSMLLEKELNDGFQWIDNRIDDKYPRFFGKIVHEGRSCIDVFPLIKTSNRKLGVKLQWMKRKILFKLYKAKINYANYMEMKNIRERLKVMIVKIISLFIPKRFIIKRVLANEMRYENNKNNMYYINLYGAYGAEKELIKTEWISKGKRIPFGGELYPVFANTHDYLAHLYGDYMTPPPLEKRIMRHEEIYNIYSQKEIGK